MAATVKNRNRMDVLCVKAKPIAVPKKGAEQGVLKRTMRMPLKKAPAKPSLRVAASMRVSVFPGRKISKAPNRFMANAESKTTIKAMNPGFWN